MTTSNKKLIITSSLNYEPFLQHATHGKIRMKCPLGDCIVEIILENSLERVVQSVALKAETIFNKDLYSDMKGGK